MARKIVATNPAFPHFPLMQEIVDDELTDEIEPGPFRGRRLKRRVFGVVLLLAAILLGIAWWQREGIANRFVESELESRNIRATYEIDEIGVRTQRIRNLVIGDPANPDLTARLVEIDVALNFSGVNLRDIRASGVRLRGRVVNGRLSFGELDKFADPTSTEPFAWPDIGLVINDASARIDTPWGVIGAGLKGSGLLRNRFVADLSLRSPRIAYSGCIAPEIKFDGELRLEWRRPRLIGPITAQRFDCAEMGLAIASPSLKSDVRLSTTFDKWFGDIGFAANHANYDNLVLAAPVGNIAVDGGIKRTSFALTLDRGGLRSEPLTVGRLEIGAKGYAGVDEGQFIGTATGDARITGGKLDRSTLAGLRGLQAQTRDTPIGPLVARIAPALQRAGDRFGGELHFDAFRDADEATGLTIGSLALNGASGVRVRQRGALSLSGGTNAWRVASPLDLAISGGSLPNVTLALRQSGGSGWTGRLEIAPYAAGGASLAVPGVSFSGSPGGAWNFAGQARLSGPLPGGSVQGLSLPIDGRYDGRGFALYDSCQNIRFERATISSLTLTGQSVRICPDRGRPIFSTGNGATRLAANMSNFAARGTLGSSPLSASSASLRFSLDEGFAARNVKFALGDPSTQTRFDIDALNGRFADNGMQGNLQGGSGQVGNVPLLIDGAAGGWSYGRDILTLDGNLRVLDAAEIDRFQPMNVPNLMLTLENNVIAAIGRLVEPKTGREVADVDIRHLLGSGSGRALLAVDGLTFDQQLQPELLTRLTLGVVANVEGSVSGDGRIEWDQSGVRSSGRFATQGMNLAAAFGPVEGLTTELVFSDLLGLVTEPGQRATVMSVNPGIPALNGQISYRLLAGQKIAIEAGRWPFAGGELVLEPTVIDFGVEADRRLTFRLIGLDAEKFLGGYDFQNLRVSGIFDGTLPMVFDQDGGRIVGGTLLSRPGGGEISYLGELSYEDMGVFANFAFQALRSIRYSELTLTMDGNLDGEIVTKINFSGLQQGSLAKRNFITNQLAKIPIQFNVTIQAEFLKLIGSIRGLYDAEYLAKQTLPFAIDPVTGEVIAPSDELPAQKDEPNDE